MRGMSKRDMYEVSDSLRMNVCETRQVDVISLIATNVTYRTHITLKQGNVFVNNVSRIYEVVSLRCI